MENLHARKARHTSFDNLENRNSFTPSHDIVRVVTLMWYRVTKIRWEGSYLDVLGCLYLNARRLARQKPYAQPIRRTNMMKFNGMSLLNLYLIYSGVPFQRCSVKHDVIYITALTGAECKSKYLPTKESLYLSDGVVFCENSRENWSRYSVTALNYDCGNLENGNFACYNQL